LNKEQLPEQCKESASINPYFFATYGICTLNQILLRKRNQGG
jgi:hypothetical protein